MMSLQAISWVLDRLGCLRTVGPIGEAHPLSRGGGCRGGELCGVGAIYDMGQPGIVSLRRIMGFGVQPFEGAQQRPITPLPGVVAKSFE
jgi:hypothetical protein